jgi:hypothetical protein
MRIFPNILYLILFPLEKNTHLGSACESRKTNFKSHLLFAHGMVLKRTQANENWPYDRQEFDRMVVGMVLS